MSGRGATFTMPPTEVTECKIAKLDDGCGNVIQVTQLMRSERCDGGWEGRECFEYRCRVRRTLAARPLSLPDGLSSNAGHLEPRLV